MPVNPWEYYSLPPEIVIDSYYSNRNFPGVKYIKIARYDAFGNDNYQSLRELDNIKIKTNDGGIINYPVVSITEYASSSLNTPYFLYETVSTNATSSTDNQILNYKLVVTQSSPPQYTTAADSGLLLIGSYDSPVVDQQNYFNITTGLYTLGNTPNISISFTASYRIFSTTGMVNPTLAAIINGGSSVFSTSNAISSLTLTNFNSAPQTMTISGSFTPIEGQTFGIYFGDLITGTSQTSTPTFVHLLITQSISPVAGIGSQTILEPYITTPFINSDYDVLMNNAVINRPNSFYLDVDFADSQILPINQQAILGNSATPAVIQDSNYSSATRIGASTTIEPIPSGWWINSRYIGKQLQSQKTNVYTIGDISYGPTPNVSNPKTYFVQFNWLAGTAPEWGNNSVGKVYTSIKYIIDENGNRTRPINDAEGINLGTIQQAFGNNNATIVLSNPNAFGADMSTLNTTVSVFKAGKKIRPIVYTQTASWDNSADPRVVLTYGYTGSIIFTQGGTPNESIGASVNDYRIVTFVPSLNTYTPTFLPNRVFEINGSAVTESFPREINFNSPIQLGISASFATSSGLVNPSTGSIYKPTGSLEQLSGSGYILYLESFLQVNSDLNNASVGGIIIDFALQKSIDGGSNWSNLATHEPYFPGNQSSFSTNFYLRYTDTSATTSSLYRVAALSRGGGFNFGNGVIQIADSSYFKVTQYPSPSTGNVTSFWMTGSNSNLLFAKKGTGGGNIGLNDVYGQKQQDIDDSGFDPILLDFEPQPYDEIRFMGTEDQTYTILQVSQSLISSEGVPNPYQSLTLKLNKNIPSNINTDFFLLRRYVDDPGTIILNINKPAGGTSDGILKPEFITSEVEAASRIILETNTPQ